MSSILVAPAGLARALSLLSRLGVEPRFEPIPGPEEIRALSNARWHDDLVADDPDGVVVPFEASTWALAKRLAAHPSVVRVIARLLVRAGQMGPTEPRELAQPDPDSLRRRYGSAAGKPARAQRSTTEWVSFHVSWGEERGADPRRLLALSCRRGQIRGSDVGSIRVLRRHSIVDVAAKAAGDFATHACRPDPREPHIQIRPMTAAEGQRPQAPRRGPPPRQYDRKKKPPKR